MILLFRCLRIKEKHGNAYIGERVFSNVFELAAGQTKRELAGRVFPWDDDDDDVMIGKLLLRQAHRDANHSR